MFNFSLRDLLTFTLASCVYLAALPSMGAIWNADEFPTSAVTTTTIIVSWVLLALVYASWRLRSALIVHFFGPVAVAVILSIAITVEGFPRDSRVMEVCLGGLTVGCFISTFFSFPTTTLMILVIAVGKRQTAKQPPTSDAR